MDEPSLDEDSDLLSYLCSMLSNSQSSVDAYEDCYYDIPPFV